MACRPDRYSAGAINRTATRPLAINRGPLAVHLPTECLRVLQLNMRRARAVSDEALQLMDEKNIDLLLCQEPYVYRRERKIPGFGFRTTVIHGAEGDENPMAAVVIRKKNISVVKLGHLSNTHCTCVQITTAAGSMYAVSMYFPPSEPIEPHLETMRTIITELRGERIVIGADANARSTLWHSDRNDYHVTRGRALELAIAELNLIVVNEPGNPPTYSTPCGTSNIDVTLATEGIVPFVRSWRVEEGHTSSDHNAILFSLLRKQEDTDAPREPRFSVAHANWEKFDEELIMRTRGNSVARKCSDREGVEVAVEEITNIVISTCDASLRKKRYRRACVPWWNEELTKQKRMTYRARKRFQNERNPEERERKKAEYYAIKRRYDLLIRRTKKESWERTVTTEGNKNPWGMVYKMCVGKITPEKALCIRQREDRAPTWNRAALQLLNALVPDDDEDTCDWQRETRAAMPHEPNTEDCETFEEFEVAQAIKSLGNGKAPGLDRIEVEVLKRSCPYLLQEITAVMNGCLQWSVFPRPWKTGSIRALLKSQDKDESQAKSYRPICLLSVLGKVLEKLISSRLRDTFYGEGYASDRQYGFRKGKSTEDAILKFRSIVREREEKYVLAILYDISGAFDNLWWPSVMDALKRRGCPRNAYRLILDYFAERHVKMIGKYGEVGKSVTRGCPQGSILGPSLWNIVFDGVLKELEEEECEAIAYADDLLVVVYGNSRNQLQERGQRVTDRIEAWCDRNKLKLSDTKTEMILAKGKLNAERPPIVKVRGRNIPLRKSVRYLGVHFDERLRVNAHIAALKEKCTAAYNSLAKVARSKWGLGHRCMHALYRGLFVPTVTYAAAAWADPLTKAAIEALKTVQRYALLRVTKAYRTVSADALPVIAGVLPIEQRIQEAVLRYKVRKDIQFELPGYSFPADIERIPARKAIEDFVISEWQRAWDASTKGRHTHLFFPNVRARLEARWITLTHEVVQMLSGHGDFNAKLRGFGLVPSENCECGLPESAQHVIYDCARHNWERHDLQEILAYESINWPATEQELVSKRAYGPFTTFAKEVLRKKMSENRRRRPATQGPPENED